MGKISKSAVPALILMVLWLFALPAQAKYAGGTGDPCDPYQINDPCQLNSIGLDPCDWDKHFILTADIDLSAYTGEQFNIIAPDTDSGQPGFQGAKFTGSFDGNGYVITNFTYFTTVKDYIGLFGKIEGSNAEVKNIGMENVNVTGDDCLGGLCGFNMGSIITNCYATGSVTGGDGSEYLGGLVGQNEYGSISDCYATGSVGGNYSRDLGGLVGKNYYGSINNCYATGSINGGDNSSGLGGLVGTNYHGSISDCYANGGVIGMDYSSYLGGLIGCNFYYSIVSNCYATGNVSGDNSNIFGGLVGKNLESIINCYATGNVSGDNSDYLGGLVGSNTDGGISNCYATGSVSGDDYLGGLVGHDYDGSYTISFWNTIVNPGLTGVGNLDPDPCKVIGETTANMQIRSTYTSAGWDFVDETTNGTNEVWQIPAGGGYPVLSNFNGYSPPALTGDGTSGNPYLIGDPNELGAIYHYDNNANYRLVADIDLSDINWSTAPITTFHGCFDGNGHTISALTIDGNEHLGLFGYVGNGGDIKNLGIVEISISGRHYYIGGLVGWNYSGSISDCYTIGSVSGLGFLGGLVGRNESGSIKDCYAISSITGKFWLGGLVGLNESGCISNCYVTCSISGGDYSLDLGGLVGQNCYGSISDCYATSSISGGEDSKYLGGLAGLNSGSINNSYATGSVSGDDYLGVLVGSNSGSISNCYASGSVSGRDNSSSLGGLVGCNRYGSISNCYTTGSVSGGDNSCYLGGLVGFQYSSNINNCFATGSVTGHNMIGGLVGWNDDERTPDSIAISDCYSTGDVTGDSSIGGLVGYNSFGTISNCYATGNVMGNYNSVGGLVGLNEDVVCSGVVANCYATGNVTGYSKIGGLVGYNMHIRIYNCYATGSVTGNSDYLGGMVGYDISGSYTGSFWNSDVNPGLTGVGNLEPDPDGVIGETTENMQIQSTFTDEGWDFVGETTNGTNDIWRMPYEATGYPMLYWQRDIDGDFVSSYGVDLYDFTVLAETWGLSSGQVGYNDLCDLMDDDVIDLNDLAVFAENWMAGK